MKTIIGTGHEQNVTNLGTITTHLSTFGDRYNPASELLKISSLNNLCQQSKEAIDGVNSAEIALSRATAARLQQFENFDVTITRVINAIRVSGLAPQVLQQIEVLVRDLRGKRASALLTEEEIAAEKANGKEIKQVTLHNTTYDRRTENFGKLVLALSTLNEYKPNETDLTLEALNHNLAAYQSANREVVAAEAILTSARQVRDELLYASGSGLTNVALMVKQYVKSAFGAASPQFMQISGISFNRPR